MNKQLFCLFLFLFLTICAQNNLQAAEFDFGYADADGSQILHFQNKIPFKYGGAEITPFQQYKESNSGYMVNLNLEIKKDIGPVFDMFFDIDYINDSFLQIDHQTDYKIGAGYTLFKNAEDKHKISYAIVNRSNELLHSFRYKYKHLGGIFRTTAICYLILPINEIIGDLSIYFKICGGFSFAINHNYKVANDKVSYFSTAGFKINY